jgi:alpha-beta hydrolase superfamily lysophospholipase
MIHHQEDTFIGKGGLRLYYQSWHPQGQAEAVVAIVHGLGSHSDAFSNIVQYLVPRRFAVYSFDLRGHGRSPGQRGHINSWAEFREDLSRFMQLIATKEPQIPHFLFGHSLGAAIALEYVLHCPGRIRGVIASALPLGKVGVSPIKMAIGKVLSRVWPRFTLNTGIAPAANSRDLDVVNAYANDPLRHTKGSARLVTEFLSTANWLQTHAFELQVPILLLHGEADRISPPEASRIFFGQVILADKEQREYGGGYHDLHDDINRQEMLADLEDWLGRHLEKKRVLCSQIVEC